MDDGCPMTPDTPDGEPRIRIVTAFAGGAAAACAKAGDAAPIIAMIGTSETERRNATFC